MIKVFEAFAGIGTQRMALRNIGVEHEVVAISEIDKHAIASYEAIHGPVNNLGDISKIKSEEIPDHDLFTYSFPCTDISAAGERKGFHKGSGTRSSLLWECERIIKDKRPKYLLMENVKAITYKYSIANFNLWLNTLESYGYTNYYFVLNSKDFSVPQFRERVFCVSIYGEHEAFQTPSPKESVELSLKFIDETFDERLLLSENQVKSFNLRKLGNVPELCGKKLVSKPSSKESPKDYLIGSSRGRSDGDRFMQHLEVKKEKTTNTLTTVQKDNYLLMIYEKEICLRKLKPIETWRLMGVRDEDFLRAQSVVSDTQLYKQAGNAIVVPVLEAIFKSLFKTS